MVGLLRNSSALAGLFALSLEECIEEYDYYYYYY